MKDEFTWEEKEEEGKRREEDLDEIDRHKRQRLFQPIEKRWADILRRKMHLSTLLFSGEFLVLSISVQIACCPGNSKIYS